LKKKSESPLKAVDYFPGEFGKKFKAGVFLILVGD